jgi:uncharacterized protein
MPSGRLRTISNEECLVLLRQVAIGRVAVTVGAMPEILPVHFALIDDAIVFRAGRDTRLHTASRGTVLAFEVDGFDMDARHGWSVLVVGPSDEVTEPGEVVAARQLLADDWVPADEDHVLCITPHRVTGRRIAGLD